MTTATPTLVNCKCRHCDGHIEFEAEEAGRAATCPHCGLETELFIPQVTAPPRPPRAWLKRWIRRWWIPLVALCGLSLSAAALVKLDREAVEIVGSLLSAVVFLAVAFLVLLWAILWSIFPVFVYYGMRRMEKLLTQIERNTRKET